jgi:hypothetical protein
MQPTDEDSYPAQEAQRRFEIALRAALNTPPKPLKDMPRKRPESKRKAGKAAKPSAAS